MFEDEAPRKPQNGAGNQKDQVFRGREFLTPARDLKANGHELYIKLY